MSEGISPVSNKEYVLNYRDIINHGIENSKSDESIFNVNNAPENVVSEANINVLNEKLSNVQDENGCVKRIWDAFKDKTGVGVSSKDCNDAIESYKRGEITYEEALAKIDEYKNRQDSSLNLFSNIATSFASIGAATLLGVAISGGMAAIPLIALAGIGAGTGALAKMGFKLADRATNKKQGDALDGKQMLKDGLSGAVTGSIAAATMGTGSCSSSLSSSIAKSGLKGMKTGAITGSISGAANYTIDNAFDKDKDMKMSELIKASVQNGICTAVVGGIIGSTNGALRFEGKLSSGGMINKVGDTVEHATTKDVFANGVCSSAYKLGNDRLHAITS